MKRLFCIDVDCKESGHFVDAPDSVYKERCPSCGNMYLHTKLMGKFFFPENTWHDYFTDVIQWIKRKVMIDIRYMLEMRHLAYPATEYQRNVLRLIVSEAFKNILINTPEGKEDEYKNGRKKRLPERAI